jgi:O-antigen/teichoic acid export membrane protein
VSKSAVILRNIASNWIGFVINAAVTLVLTPYVLRELGVARYGIWILTSSFIGYYGLLDLGFRTGVTQYLTRYLALRDYGKASETLSTAVAALSLLGMLMIALSFIAAYIAPHLFTIPPDMTQEAFWCILIVGISSAVQCVFSPFAAMFTSLQRFDLSNLIGIITRLLTAGGIVAALKTGHGLIGVSIAFCGANVIDYLIRWRVSLQLAPELEVTWQRAKIDRMREIASFGAWNFLTSLNYYIFNYVPNMLIGAFMPIAAVGHFALAIGLSRQVNSILGPVAQVMYPAATELHVQGDLVGLEKLYHQGSRLMMLVMIPAVLGATFWAEDFYRLWIGESYLDGSAFQSVALLFQILLLSTVTCFTTSIAQQILIGSGKVQQVAIALIIGSAINLTFSLILIHFYGLAGIAIATVIASVVIDLIAMPFMLQRLLGLTVIAFVRNSCVRPLIAGLLQAILMISIRYIGTAENFVHLALQGILAVTASIVVLVSIGLTREDQQRFLVGPLRRLGKKA